MCLAQTWTSQSGDQSTNHEVTMLSKVILLLVLNYNTTLFGLKYACLFVIHSEVKPKPVVTISTRPFVHWSI